MSAWAWHISFTVPVGTIARGITGYLLAGALIVPVLEFALYRMWQRRGMLRDRSFVAMVRGFRTPGRRYLCGVYRWPLLVVAAIRAERATRLMVSARDHAALIKVVRIDREATS